MLELNPVDGFFVMVGIGAILWGIVDLYSGTAWLWPTIYRPGVSFSQEDDGPLFYMAVSAKIGTGVYLFIRIFGLAF